MIVILTYDLKGKRDYSALFDAIKQEGVWWHYMASTWLLNTAKGPYEIANDLKPFLDQYDYMFVAPIAPAYSGWLPEQAWEWIRTQANVPPPVVLGPVPPPPQRTTLLTRPPGQWGPSYIKLSDLAGKKQDKG
ncbi:MAG: hypothetical protein LAO19_01445 [Acidobacteriia bacterium]|nr:hypothetical protein [Terriglobia bacterium]